MNRAVPDTEAVHPLPASGYDCRIGIPCDSRRLPSNRAVLFHSECTCGMGHAAWSSAMPHGACRMDQRVLMIRGRRCNLRWKRCWISCTTRTSQRSTSTMFGLQSAECKLGVFLARSIECFNSMVQLVEVYFVINGESIKPYHLF